MSGFMSKWSVRTEFTVGTSDLDGQGHLARSAVEGWIDDVCDRYLAQCGRFSARASEENATIRKGSRALGGIPTADGVSSVVVSATVTEVHPTSFTISVRLRQVAVEHVPPSSGRVVVTAEPASGEPIDLGDDIRDELIAIERGARYSN